MPRGSPPHSAKIHHGYLHEHMQGIDADTEARYLDRGLEALAKAAGVEPVGYRRRSGS